MISGKSRGIYGKVKRNQSMCCAALVYPFGHGRCSGRMMYFDLIDDISGSLYSVCMITDADVKKLKAVFVSKDDLKSPSIHDQLKKTVRDELDAVKPDCVREITDSVTTALGDKIDKMYVKLDSFIGEIKTRREEDTLHTKQHDDITDRLKTVEKKLGLPTFNN